eukprot:scaffold70055_cov51-Phaeocystis_antarctica.AAC.3
MAPWHARCSAKANTAGSAGSVTHPRCSCRGVPDACGLKLAGDRIDEDCHPVIFDCGPDYFVKVP